MNLIDSKYIGIISSRLQKFKRVKPDLYNFRCPICGDSKKNKSKTRGYLYSVKADMNFRCHNCGASMTFSNFLRQLILLFRNSMSLKGLRMVRLEEALWLKNLSLILKHLSSNVR